MTTTKKAETKVSLTCSQICWLIVDQRERALLDRVEGRGRVPDQVGPEPDHHDHRDREQHDRGLGIHPPGEARFLLPRGGSVHRGDRSGAGLAHDADPSSAVISSTCSCSGLDSAWTSLPDSASQLLLLGAHEVGDRREVDDADVAVTVPGDDRTAVAVGQHRVERVVERGPVVDVDQVLLAGVDRLALELAQPRPGGGSLVVVEDDHRSVTGSLGAGLHLGGALADRRGRRVPQLDLGDAGEAELLQRGPGPHEVGHEVVGRAGQDRLGGVVLRDLRALLEDQDPVAELDRLVDVVGDADDRLAQLALDGEQLVLQPLAGDRVDRAERLVHQDHGRVGGQAAGHADALLLPAGELAGVAVAVLLRVEADQLEQLVDPLGDPAGVPAEQLGHDRDVLGHRHVREQAAALDHVADRAPQLVGALAAHVLVADVDRRRRSARSAG